MSQNTPSHFQQWLMQSLAAIGDCAGHLDRG